MAEAHKMDIFVQNKGGVNNGPTNLLNNSQ